MQRQGGEVLRQKKGRADSTPGKNLESKAGRIEHHAMRGMPYHEERGGGGGETGRG